MSTSSGQGMSGKVYDPVFLCMLGAVVLAVGTSIALRVVSAGAGPSAARAAEIIDEGNQRLPALRTVSPER